MFHRQSLLDMPTCRIYAGHAECCLEGMEGRKRGERWSEEREIEREKHLYECGEKRKKKELGRRGEGGMMEQQKLMWKEGSRRMRRRDLRSKCLMYFICMSVYVSTVSGTHHIVFS